MEFLRAGQVTLHYARGNGPRAVVLLHALGTDLRVWDGVVARLPGGALRHDARGHGLSEAGPGPVAGPVAGIDAQVDDLAALMDAEGARGAVVCGLSMGGQVALGLAARRPDLVAALVLCCTAHRIGPREMWDARIEAVRAGGMGAVADAALERWLSPACRRERPALAAGLRAMLLRTPPEGYAAACAAVRDADMTEAARAVRVPTLCVAGAEDAATPPALVADLAALIPGARLEVIEGAGHLACVEAPGRMAELVRGVAEELDAQASRHERGMAVRRAVLGEAHVDRAEAATTPFDAPFQALVAEAAWGSVWTRPGLTLRERSLVTLAMLIARGHWEEVEMHLRATARTGATPEDLSELMLHAAIYAGVPAANRAVALAKRVLAERGVEEEG